MSGPLRIRQREIREISPTKKGGATLLLPFVIFCLRKTHIINPNIKNYQICCINLLLTFLPLDLKYSFTKILYGIPFSY